ncbi:MAG: hypothetical protein KKD44_18770 [Proteobacteria bacterium]|nr:hypothetical protein [Pseudomonadota bacterium]
MEQDFIRAEDLEKAMDIRSKNLKRAELPLGMILLKLELITNKNLNDLLLHPETQKVIKKNLQGKNWIPKDERDEFFKCLEKNPNLKKLVDQGRMTMDQLNLIIREAMDRVAFLKLALRQELIRGKDLEEVLLMKRYNKSISEILLDEHLVSLSELNFVYRKCDESLKLGTILVLQNLITPEQIEKNLAEQKVKKDSLGQILLRNGMISLAQLYFALSIQFNTPFRELKGFTFNGKQEAELRDIVGQIYATENLIIPLFLNENNLTLAVSNPAHIVKMHELMSRYSHLNMSCVLITDEKFEQLYAMLYGEILKAPAHRVSMGQDMLCQENGKWVITDPSSQLWLISNLYECYATLCTDAGSGLIEKKKDLFLDFILESFDTICRDYDCQSVSFWFDMETGTPAIKASPVLRASVVG